MIFNNIIISSNHGVFNSNKELIEYQTNLLTEISIVLAIPIVNRLYGFGIDIFTIHK
jgi:hypothetical protein